MKVCLCISGQLRDLETALAQLEQAVAGHDVFLIFSVWSTIGRKLDGALNLYQLGRMFDAGALAAIPSEWHGHDVLWTRMPALREQLLRSGGSGDPTALSHAIHRRFPDALIDIEDAEFLDLEFTEPRQDRNSVRMTYKIWRADQIRKQMERRAGLFEVVIRARADLRFENLRLGEIVKRVEEGQFLINDWRPGDRVAGDNFAAGSPADMSAYASLFGRAITQPMIWTYIHHDLADHLQANGLNVHQYDGVQDPIEDERASAAELASALRVQKGRRLVWSDLHDATLAAAQAAALLDQGEAGRALEVLAAWSAARPPGAPAPDNLLHMLGRALQAAGVGAPAVICLFAARFWTLDPFDPRRETAARAVAAAAAPELDASGPFRPEAYAAGLQADGEFGWAVRAAAAARPPEALIMEALSEPETRLALARAFAEIGRPDLTLAGFEALAPSLPEASPELHNGIHNIIRTAILDGPAGDLEAGRGLLDFALKLAGVTAYHGYALADDFKTAGRFAEAAYLQSAVLETDPTHGGAQRQMAEVLLHLGELDGAWLHATRAVELQDIPDHRMLLAYAAWRRGEAGLAEAERAGLPSGALPPAAYAALPEFSRFLRDGAAAPPTPH